MTTATNEPTTGAGRRLLAQWAGVPNAPAALVVQAIAAIEAEAAHAERDAIRAAWLDRAGDGGFFTALLRDILDAREPSR